MIDIATFIDKVVAMSQSDAALFAVGPFTITERHIIYLTAFVVAVAMIVMVQTISKAIVSFLRKKLVVSSQIKQIQKEIDEKTARPEPVMQKSSPAQPAAQPPPEDISLVDTSGRKRSLYDYVTPDSMHAEVMKQSINTDFPYQSLQPANQKTPEQQTTPISSTDTQPLNQIEFPTPPSNLPPLRDQPVQGVTPNKVDEKPAAPVTTPAQPTPLTSVTAQVAQPVPTAIPQNTSSAPVTPSNQQTPVMPVPAASVTVATPPPILPPLPEKPLPTNAPQVPVSETKASTTVLPPLPSQAAPEVSVQKQAVAEPQPVQPPPQVASPQPPAITVPPVVTPQQPNIQPATPQTAVTTQTTQRKPYSPTDPLLP